MVPCGVGVDIVSVRRIEEIYARYGERFLKKVFPGHYPEYCFEKRKGEIFGCIASRFALKEAFVKAYSQFGISLLLSQVKVLGGGKDLKIETPHSHRFIHKFSLSHERDYAVAFALLFKRT